MSEFNIENLNDEPTWDLICEGKTKGVFQLESNLGRHWAKQIKPRNIKQLSDLISLIRPGTLQAISKGKSMTQHYADRKAGIDDVEYPHQSLEPLLKETYGIICYQEQTMKIAQELAGFSLVEADVLRKAIGKKKADLMAEMKELFINGSEKVGIISKEIASEIFSWIEKSSRYSFNLSHGVCYAINAYWSAYCKTHKPLKFYVTYLNYSGGKPDPQNEIKELVMDAKSFGIETYPPRLNHLYNNFIGKDNTIYYGLSHIKNVGSAECDKIQDIKSKYDISSFTWMDCLIKIIYHGKINKRAAIALISVGAFTGNNNLETRQKMLYEYDSWCQLTAREKVCLSEIYNPKETLVENLTRIPKHITINMKRIVGFNDIVDALASPFYNLEDTIPSLVEAETKFLGVSLTCSHSDSVNLETNMCSDIVNGLIKGKVRLCATLTKIKKYKTKRGKNPGQDMAFLVAEDSSGQLDSITIFPKEYEEHKDLLLENNTVLLLGEVSKKDKNSVIINKVIQI